RVAAHQVAYVFNAALAHLFGLAERPAHADDCSVVLFDPRFPGRNPLLHLCVSRLLGKGVPGCHTRAGFATEEDGEKRIVRAHNVSFFQRSFCEASTLVSACLTFGSESGLLTTPASRARKALPRRSSPMPRVHGFEVQPTLLESRHCKRSKNCCERKQ